MEVKILGETNSIFNQYIAEIRDEIVQKDSLRFRRNLERLGEVFAYEISKTLCYKINDVKTPLGIAKVPKLKSQPVLATILRAGLPLQQGLLNIFDQSENAFISAYRKYDENNEFHIEFEYLASPSLDEKVVIISDPMLASGASMEIGYRALLEKGTPNHVHLVAIIGSRKGLEYVTGKIKAENVTLWLGAIDEDMNEKSYIIPGLGDAGDLAFGPKIDSH
ncbi:MAG: uracil phosphoribosyltransferase [Bacteroidetes bacterium GWF2_42_66]|nr:MAG: uracil phosphoribosyltransferase [Bacteroidetes bacterium GWA2_42_15]OFY01986.1 MAG: uracil phosphoribosyltransferase [Bacteroidetes bacterium GWE2_42_39]OFY44964.1 MAG: uracil phosphoribosyltransferase [Bacteroidetes bacterium GWF2_42_66]HBL75883.1 uracil phosphoribosyltransferase [Prolixibacteraceae bacterium]HCR89128.1 uracil phosphoribosyltransferase [Prolixibacteraceae bacterium]